MPCVIRWVAAVLQAVSAAGYLTAIFGGELITLRHVDMFAHNKSGSACQNESRQPEVVS
jgi:hypothetical protein